MIVPTNVTSSRRAKTRHRQRISFSQRMIGALPLYGRQPHQSQHSMRIKA
jgi:hypothetical protein